MRVIGFLVLTAVLFTSLFRIEGAELTPSITTVAVMVLLLSLFSDLDTFNFLGFSGKKKIQSLQDAEGGDALSRQEVSAKERNEVAEAAQEPLRLMDDDMGNFLALAFEIERLLNLIAPALLGEKEIKSLSNIVHELHKIDFLTDNGVKQLDGIRWLRNMLTHGRSGEVNIDSIKLGYRVALSFYTELRNWLDGARATSK